ncbi:MAG: hypothetical protein HYT21_01755 [Candidatus Nealsonbacteria bacterium]|nr:hypothetical protein [Candidatus Nealsonbacteria bacterium]
MNFKYLKKNIPTSTSIMAIIITAVFFLGIFGWQQGLITESKKSTLSPAPTSDTTTKDLPAVVASARQDLAATLKVDASQIIVEELSGQWWSDSSLGCPKEGEFYTQAIESGQKVVFLYQQKKYEYHTDAARRFVFCESK